MKTGRKIGAVIAVITLALLIWLGSRQNTGSEETAYVKDIFAMDTYFVLKAYGSNGEDALIACENKIQELEKLLSVTLEDSDIRKLNQRTDLSVEEDTLTLLRRAFSLCEETGGALDITLYPILQKWGFTTDSYRVPSKEELTKLLDKVNYKQVIIDETAGSVALPEGMELDLGAVAKGYTGDCLLEILKERGVTSAMVDLGGNVQVLGSKPDGSLWKIAVRNPFDTTKELGVLEVSDRCVITSGSYERFFEMDGEKYWHILDPKDGYPADSGLVSVTVVGDNGIRCDGLSTALFVMGRNEAESFWRQAGDFEMILVTTDGALYLTEGLQDCFVCGEGWNAQIINR